MKELSITDKVWRTLLSLSPLLIYAFGAFFPPGPQTDRVELRPPTWLFGLAWGVLVFGLVGTCLALTFLKEEDNNKGLSSPSVVFLLLTTTYVVLACLWLVLYSGAKKGPGESPKGRAYAAGVLLLATFVAAALLICAVVSPRRVFAFAVPLLLLLWSCFATALNTLEVLTSR